MPDVIPNSFSRFTKILEWLISRKPSGIALAGSYGNCEKKPDSHSDLDILFVYKTKNILGIVRELLTDYTNKKGLMITYLGVHPQFGHLVNAYFEDNPIHWVDIGIMDENFARNYLTGQLITVIKGRVDTTGMLPNHHNQMSQLARKIIKANQRKDKHLMKIYCYRYAQWAKINTSKIKSVENLLMRVFTDIKSEFPHFLQDWNKWISHTH